MTDENETKRFFSAKSFDEVLEKIENLNKKLIELENRNEKQAEEIAKQAEQIKGRKQITKKKMDE